MLKAIRRLSASALIAPSSSLDGSSTDITFTVQRADLARAVERLERAKADLKFAEIKADINVAKVSVIGVGMRSHAELAVRALHTAYELDAA